MPLLPYPIMIRKFTNATKAKAYLSENISTWCRYCINASAIYKEVKALAAESNLDGILAVYAAYREIEITDNIICNQANRVYNAKIQEAFTKESEEIIKITHPEEILDAVKLVQRAMAVFEDLEELESFSEDSLAVAYARELDDYQYMDCESDYFDDDVIKVYALYTISDKDDRPIISAEGFLNKVLPGWSGYFDISDVDESTITLKSHSWFWCLYDGCEDEAAQQYNNDLSKEMLDKIDYLEWQQAY